MYIRFFIFAIFFINNIINLCHKFFYIKTSYYPEEIACIDKSLKGYGKLGIAQYWDARKFTFLSKENIKINASLYNLSPFAWATNVNRFKNSYDFAIIDIGNKAVTTGKLDKSFIIQINKNPEKKVICGDKEIFIYPKDKLRVPFFIQAGNNFTWYAANLNSEIINSLTKDNKRIANENIKGFLIYGPYILLTKGYYEFSVRYKSNANYKQKVGLLDIFTGKSGQISFINLLGTNNEFFTIKGKFHVNALQENRDHFEIRIFTLGNSKLIFDSLTLIKI